MKKIVIILAAFLLSGCGIQNYGSSLKANRYFSQKDYEKGVAEFTNKVRESPDNAVAHFYLGRFYLAQNKPSSALIHLEKAVVIQPSESDYQFWLGVAYGESGKQKEEYRQYLNALRENSNHAKAKLYLAHLLLKQGQY